MRRSLSIALTSVYQGIRAQTFWIAAFLFASLLAMAFTLRVLAIGEKEVVLRNLCLSSIELSALMMIIFGFAHGFFRDRDSRLRSIYLTYVSKGEYLSGKLLGGIATIFLYLLLTSLLSSGLLAAEQALRPSFFLGGFSIFLKLAVITSFCLLFSCLLSSPILASLLTSFLYVTCELSSHALSIMSQTQNSSMRSFYRFLYHLLPNSDKLDLKYQIIYDTPVPLGYLGEITIYALAYTGMVYLLSYLLFERQEH